MPADDRLRMAFGIEQRGDVGAPCVQADPAAIDEETLSARLYTAGMPDPDLLIRTSGERRISNFLLWQTAYSELYISDLFWPEFRRGELYKAIEDYQRLVEAQERDEDGRRGDDRVGEERVRPRRRGGHQLRQRHGRDQQHALHAALARRSCD